MASWWMIGSRFPLLILPLSIYPFDGEKRCYFLFRLFGIFFSLSLSDSGWWFMSLYTIAIVNLFRLPPSIGRRGVTWLAIRFFCVFWISRHPRTSYRIKSVYSLMLQTIVERSSFFSFLFFGCMCLLKTRWWQWWSDEQGPIYCGLYSRLQYIRVFVFTVGTLMGELYYTDLPSLDDRRLTVPSVPCFLLKWTSSLNRGRGLSVSASTLSPSLPFKMQLTNQSSSPFYVRHTATVCFTIALFVEPEINPASRGHPVPKFPLVDSSISVVFSMRNSPTRPNSTIFYLSECCCFNM